MGEGDGAISCSLILHIRYPTDNIIHTAHSLKARSCASVGWRLNSQRFKGSLAITPGLMKGPANNWAPVTKPLLYALVPMAFPVPIPGPESLWQGFGWDVVCSSQRWEMFLKSQLSDHSPAFSSMTDAHPLSGLADLRCSQNSHGLLPTAPVLKSSVKNSLVSWSLTAHVNGSFLQTLCSVCVWTSSLGLGSEPFPTCLLCHSLFLGVGSCQELQTTVTDLGRSRQLCYLSSLCLEKIFQIMRSYCIAQSSTQWSAET